MRVARSTVARFTVAFMITHEASARRNEPGSLHPPSLHQSLPLGLTGQRIVGQQRRRAKSAARRTHEWDGASRSGSERMRSHPVQSATMALTPPSDDEPHTLHLTLRRPAVNGHKPKHRAADGEADSSLRARSPTVRTKEVQGARQGTTPKQGAPVMSHEWNPTPLERTAAHPPTHQRTDRIWQWQGHSAASRRLISREKHES
eukprot:CAMPEP_0196779980 /NCGR_PEP_ID=MMETSP1104-20130614/6692_1 /TAXON_ID=33652 /ORGANISM="Cafeteria sp., Strain Caron Lab Isolate" /LENGTH=202 /DNA_ID=CAMNT_0042150167 /DNA_START=98 /DNA_END=707 /DNA_ORIENTATION=-